MAHRSSERSTTASKTVTRPRRTSGSALRRPVEDRIHRLRAKSASLPTATIAHQAAVRTPIHVMTAQLQALLTRQLTAYILGVKDPKSITRWATANNAVIREPRVERRLLATYQIATMLLKMDSPNTVKAWFVGMNPSLADLSPAEAIRMDRESEALDAAREFIAYG